MEILKYIFLFQISMAAKIGIYKGKPTIELRENDDDDFFVMSFGVRKARIILEHLKEIKAFAESDGESIESTTNG